MKNSIVFICLTIIAFIIFPQLIIAQNNAEIDSLIKQIKTMPDDTNKVKTLLQVSKLSLRNNSSFAINNLIEAELLASNLGDTLGFVSSLLLQTRIYTQKGNLDSAKIKVTTVVNYLETNNKHPKLLAKAYFYAGNVFTETYDYKIATNYLLKSLDYYEKTDHKRYQSMAIGGLSRIYILLDNNEKAIEYLQKAIMLSSKTSLNYQVAISHLAIAYKNIGNYEKALKYNFEALEIEIENGDSLNIAKSYNSIGVIYKKMEDYDKSIYNLNKAFEIKEKLGNPKHIASSLNNIADIELIKKDFKSVIELSKRSYELANGVNAKKEVSYALNNLFSAYEATEQYKDALTYYKLLSNTKDSVFYENEASKSLIYKYEIQAKDNEIKLQQAQSKNKTYLIIVLGLFILTVASTAYFYIKNQKNKHRQKIVEERVKEAENQKRRFAKELHDDTGSNLSGIRLQLLALKDQTTISKIEDIISEVERTHQGIRLLSYQASPPEFDNYTLDEALDDLVQRLTKSGLIQIHFSNTIKFNWSQINQNYQLSIYRIIQEALSNIIKHAEAHNVEIQIIQHRNNINVMIEDDGKGFEITVVDKGLGHKNIQERTESLKGNFKIDSSPGNGTSIIIDLPLPKTILDA